MQHVLAVAFQIENIAEGKVMPSLSGREYRLNTKGLTDYLLSRGLTPRTSKWETVWFRKMHKFMEPRD
jgi:hypothetical protein